MNTSTGETLHSESLNRLKLMFEDAFSIMKDISRLRQLIADVLGELRLHRSKDDIFRRIAWRDLPDDGGAYKGAEPVVTTRKLEASLTNEERKELMDWWFQRIKTLAADFPDLKGEISELIN